MYIDAGVWRERTILLSFSASKIRDKLHKGFTQAERSTDVHHIPTPSRVQAQRSAARGTLARVKMADELVEARFVGDVGAAQLQDAFTAQHVFERFVADDALSSDKCPLSPAGVYSVDVQHC